MPDEFPVESRPAFTPFVRFCRAVTVAGVVLGLLPLLARWWWIADLLANLRVQLIIGLAVLTSVVMFSRRGTYISTLAILTAFNGFALLPAFWNGESEPLNTTAAPVSFRVCSNNVYIGNRNRDAILASIDEAASDIIAVIELSESLKHHVQTQLKETHPHVVSGGRDDGTFGIGLWSRFPVMHSEVFYLCEPLVPSIEADIDINGRLVRVIATHPIPPVRASAFKARNVHLSLLSERIRKFKSDQPNVPVILVGDLNLTPWSPHFDRLLRESEMQSAATGRGLQPTWYGRNSFLFGLVIDHGLFTPELRCVKRRILNDTGSDHRPIVLDFQL
jgi:endonuclease/exonuclease/phosphatase (EEP) superfamily protein YafD